MREILFRAKRTNGNGWVYGSYNTIIGNAEMLVRFDVSDNPQHELKNVGLDIHLISETHLPDRSGWDYRDSFRHHKVTPETVGQYTGLKDKNGVKIFEDDIVTCEIYEREGYIEQESGIPIKVSYDQGGFYPFYKGFGWRSSVEDIEVIGNIHDNPELLNQTA